MQTNQQMVLFGTSPVTEKVAKAFSNVEIKGKDGVIVGTGVKLLGRKELQTAFNLKGKDNKDALDAAVLEASDEALRVVKGQIGALNGDWTLGRMAQRTLGSGVRQVTLVLKEIKRKKNGPTDEQIAEVMGLTVEEVAELRASQLAKLAAASQETAIDVNTPVTTEKE